MSKFSMMVVSGWLVVSVRAALVWQGGDLFTESSWLDDRGAVPPEGAIESNVALAADTGAEKLVLISSGTSSPTNFTGNFHVANNSVSLSDAMVLSADVADIAAGNGQLKSTWAGAGQVLTVSNGALLQVGDVRNFGTVLVDGATVNLTRYITTSSSTGVDLAIANGSSFSAGYISGYANATVDASSSMTLTDPANPLRNNLYLGEGAQLTLVDAGMFATEAAQIFVDGMCYANNGLVLEIEGNTATAVAYGGPVFGSPFQNGMVLQRGKTIQVWGTSNPSNTVSVSIDGTSAEGVADAEGNWSVELPALSAGGPFELVAVGAGWTNTLTDVLVGDVWIAFGQSNMVRPLSEMTNKQAYIDDISTNRMIRCLEIVQDAALTPQSEGSMTWRDNSDPGSWGAVAAVFAHQMHAGSGVPTAVVWAGWGSSSIEGWMPVEMTNGFPHFAAMMEHYQSIGEYNDGDATSSRLPSGYSSNLEGIAAMINGETAWDDIFIRTRPNIIYNQRIHPLRNFGISGFVWYQGEANAGTPENVAQYGFTLPAFVTEYRERFGQGDLPFLGVQLPSYNSTYWAWFRESQGRVAALENAYVAVTIDTGLSSNIHPYDKEPIGRRLALLGRKYALGEDIVAHGPTFESMSIEGGAVTIGFSAATGLTTDDAAAPSAFELAGADQVWYAATDAAISGTNVVVSSSSVAAPVAVRYAWLAFAKDSINLVNGAGLPAAPFRTDNWAMPGLGAQAPMAVNDSYATYANQALTVPAEGVLENDIDLNRDPLSASLVSGTAHGSLALASDGSFSYVPNPNYIGYDSFVYTSSDGALSEDATVSIAVYALGGAPAFTTNAISASTAYADVEYTASIAAYAFGPDDMVFSRVSGPGWLAVSASGALSGSPGSADAGLNEFVVEVSDGEGRTDRAALTIEVIDVDVLYDDTFDGDGLAVNSAIGGGLINKTWYGSGWVDDGNLTAPSTSTAWYRSLVYSESSFAVSNGFTLDVVFDIAKTAISGDQRTTATFGLVSEEIAVADMDFMFSRDAEIYGIGMSLAEGLTDGVGVQGLHLDTGTLTPLSNALTVTTGTGKTFTLTVTPDGSWSYGIDGAEPTTGTGLVFDLAKSFRFAAYVRQDPGLAIRRVSLRPVAGVSEEGDIAFEMLPGTSQMKFAWASRSGVSYVLESTGDLVDGPWSIVTNLSGTGSTLSVTEELDQTNRFYRVYWAE
ncbi:Ig-like domain-containing protein [Pontiella sp.]|uniref:Ig-like domain-containing protein n=1 Tax=Pontiella sp. TaxID=2837462 RepID=UPI003561AC07